MDWHLLGLSFVTIFLAELADRSSIAAFAISGSTKYPRAVFFGTASALLAVNFIGAMVGGELAELLPLQVIKFIAAVGFAYLGIHLLWYAKDSSSGKKKSFVEDETVDHAFRKKLVKKLDNNPLSVFSSTFVTIFLASIGDEEQIATLLLSAHSGSPWVVFSGAALAVISTSLLAVLLGQGLARSLSPKILKRISGVLLLLVSIWLFFNVFYPGEFDL